MATQIDPRVMAAMMARKRASMGGAPAMAPRMPPGGMPPGAAPGMKKGGMTKMSSGGSASSRADGIAQRGKTKGTFVMCGGGMTRK